MLEWAAMFSFRGSSWPRDWTDISCMSPALAGVFFYHWDTWEAPQFCLWTRQYIISPSPHYELICLFQTVGDHCASISWSWNRIIIYQPKRIVYMQNAENCEYSVIISCCGTTGHKNNINNGQLVLTKKELGIVSILCVIKLDCTSCGMLSPIPLALTPCHLWSSLCSPWNCSS